MRRTLSWIFVRGPAAFYGFADDTGGSALFSVVVLASIAAAGGLGGGVGALVGLITGGSVGDAAFTGSMIGGAALLGWMVWVLVLVAVLWVRGQAPVEVAAGSRSQGKRAGSPNWRRPGEPLVPGSLVAFFAAMAVIAAGIGGYAWYRSRPLPSPMVIVSGKVVELREAPWYSKGSGTAIIRYSAAGADHSFEVGQDPDDRIFRMDDVVPVEYSAQRPAKGRSIAVADAAREDAKYLRIAAVLCLGLTVVSGIGRGVGRWRANGRRFGG